MESRENTGIKPLGLIRRHWSTWYILGGLIALEILMSFSFLGYLHVGPLSVTFAYIPVMLAGYLLGPVSAVITGFVFGLASLWKASAPYVAEIDHLFSPFYSGRPWTSILLSVGIRTLFGLVIGLLYATAKKAQRFAPAAVLLVTLCGRMLHSLLVYQSLGALFPEYGFSIRDAFNDFGSLRNIAQALFSVLLIQLCCGLRRLPFFRTLGEIRYATPMSPEKKNRYRAFLLSACATLLVVTGAVAVYFIHRTLFVLQVLGSPVTADIQASVSHLQIQFSMGILSIVFLLDLFLSLNHIYSSYIQEQANRDELTQLLNRRGFLEQCRVYFEKEKQPYPGYFLILDVDRFKQINDTFGHPHGDATLCAFAECLQQEFGPLGFSGRMGGDEFAVLIRQNLPQPALTGVLTHFMRTVKAKTSVSCSIGCCPIPYNSTLDPVYRQADSALYTAKQNGRDQFVIEHAPDRSRDTD